MKKDPGRPMPRWEISAKHGNHIEVLGVYEARTSDKARRFALAEHGARLGLKQNKRTHEWNTTGWAFPRRLVKDITS